MRRSHIFSITASASFVTFLVAACGDSVTGVDTTGAGQDSGTVLPDTGAGKVTPTPEAGAPETSTPDAAATDGGPPTLSSLTLNFGQIDCGTTGTAQTFVLQNPGDFDLPWSGIARPRRLLPVHDDARERDPRPGRCGDDRGLAEADPERRLDRGERVRRRRHDEPRLDVRVGAAEADGPRRHPRLQPVDAAVRQHPDRRRPGAG